MCGLSCLSSEDQVFLIHAEQPSLQALYQLPLPRMPAPAAEPAGGGQRPLRVHNPVSGLSCLSYGNQVSLIRVEQPSLQALDQLPIPQMPAAAAEPAGGGQLPVRVWGSEPVRAHGVVWGLVSRQPQLKQVLLPQGKQISSLFHKSQMRQQSLLEVGSCHSGSRVQGLSGCTVPPGLFKNENPARAGLSRQLQQPGLQALDLSNESQLRQQSLLEVGSCLSGCLMQRRICVPDSLSFGNTFCSQGPTLASWQLNILKALL